MHDQPVPKLAFTAAFEVFNPQSGPTITIALTDTTHSENNLLFQLVPNCPNFGQSQKNTWIGADLMRILNALFTDLSTDPEDNPLSCLANRFASLHTSQPDAFYLSLPIFLVMPILVTSLGWVLNDPGHPDQRGLASAARCHCSGRRSVITHRVNQLSVDP